MSQSIVCPDCGHRNPPDVQSCERCNFPLEREDPSFEPRSDRDVARAAPPGPRQAARRESAEPFDIPRPPRRPRRRPGALAPQSMQLWLLFAVFVAGAIVFEAVRANIKRRATTAVEGSNTSQQQVADEARAALERDSTNVDAHVALGNVLFDTKNWSEAIVHYRAAVRRDSSRIGALVDLGVCYYNLGAQREAERLFELALSRDPRQPVALFNLGFVNENRGDDAEALRLYHRALETGPGDELRAAVVAAVQRIQEKTGRTPAPLPGGP